MSNWNYDPESWRDMLNPGLTPEPNLPTPGDPNLEQAGMLQQRVEGISVLMGQIQTNFNDVAKLLGSIPSIIDRSIDSTERLAGSQTKVTKGIKEQTVAQQKALELQQKQAQSQEKINDLASKASQGDQKSIMQLRQRMRDLQMYSRQQGGYLIPGYTDASGNVVQPRHVAASEVDEILARPDSDETRQALLTRLRGQQATADANPKGNTRFRVGDLVQAASRGDIGGVLSELMQRGRLSAGVTSRLENLGVSSGLADTTGMLFTPAAALGALELFRRTMSSVNQSRDIGRITGQGFEAGAETRLSAFVAGLNPFDMLSSRDALEAQISARQAGYSGSAANSVADLVTDMRQKLGIPISQAAQLVTTSLRDANLTLSQTRAQLDQFTTIVRTTGQSMTEYTKAVQDAITQVAATGTQGSAAAVAPTIAGLSQQFAGTLGRQQASILQSFIANPQQRQALGALQGYSPAATMGSEFARNFQTIFDQEMLRIARGNIGPDGKPNMAWDAYAVYLVTYFPNMQQLFGSTPPIRIAEIFKRLVHIQETQGTQAAVAGTQQRSQTRSLALGTATGQLHDQLGDIFQQTLSHTEWGHGVVQGQVGDRQAAEARQDANRVLNNLQRQLVAGGMSSEKVQQLLAPGRTEIENFKRGDTPDSLVKSLDKLIKAISKEPAATKVQIQLNPAARAYFTPSDPMKSWSGWINGLNGSQGVTRTPIGG